MIGRAPHVWDDASPVLGPQEVVAGGVRGGGGRAHVHAHGGGGGGDGVQVEQVPDAHLDDQGGLCIVKGGGYKKKKKKNQFGGAIEPQVSDVPTNVPSMKWVVVGFFFPSQFQRLPWLS